jgi:hypothetical protein
VHVNIPLQNVTPVKSKRMIIVPCAHHRRVEVNVFKPGTEFTLKHLDAATGMCVCARYISYRARIRTAMEVLLQRGVQM